MNLTIGAGKQYEKWLVIAAGFLMVFFCLGFCSSNKGLYLSAITEAMGIRRSLFSVNDSVRYITTAVVNLFFGRLILRFGAKKLVGFGFCCLILFAFISSFAIHVTHFYAGGFFLGLGLSFTTTSMVSYLVGRWCPEKRGTISGAVLCANGIGGALAAQIITPLIYDEADPFGYRHAYRLVALLLLVTGILVTIVIHEPGKADSSAIQKKKARGRQWEGIPLQHALRRLYFYGAAVCVFITGMSLQGISGIASAHMRDVGLDPGYIATVSSVSSLTLAGTKFLSGLCYDRFGLGKTLTVCNLFGFAAFLCLAFCENTPVGKVLTMIYGVFASCALPLETVIVPLIAADLFGEKEYAKILGIFVSINTAGFALGTPAANLVFDSLGTYRPALFAVSTVFLVLIWVYHFIRKASEKEKQRLA